MSWVEVGARFSNTHKTTTKVQYSVYSGERVLCKLLQFRQLSKKKLNYLSLESMEQVETDQNFDRKESPLCYSAFIAGFHIQYYYIDETGKLLLFLAIYLGSGKESQHKDLVEICIFTSQRTILKFGCNFANNPCSSVSYLKKLILFRMVFFLCFWDNRENKTDE